jgi:hypothetical protein
MSTVGQTDRMVTLPTTIPDVTRLPLRQVDPTPEPDGSGKHDAPLSAFGSAIH